jgi:metallo-beta-lactamase family protein
MVTGGRIFRSLQNWQNISDAILFLVGYQGENTQGKLLLDGHRTIKDNEGNLINWTGKIFSSEAFSSHADQTELLSWVSHSKPKKVFLIHGDQEAKLVLKEKLGSMVSAEIIIPQMNDSFTL